MNAPPPPDLPTQPNADAVPGDPQAEFEESEQAVVPPGIATGNSPLTPVRLAQRFAIDEARIDFRVKRWSESLQPFVSGAGDQQQACSELAVEILWKLLDRFGEDRGIRLAATVDVSRLVERHFSADYLFDPQSEGRALLLTREQLAMQLARLHSFLEENRQVLVSDGLPEARFDGSRRLFEWLGYLYPVRRFKSRRDLPRSSAARGGLWYRWVRRKQGPDLVPVLIVTDRENAELTPGMSSTDVGIIESLRPQLLSIKLEILRDLVCALLRNKGSRSWLVPLARLRDGLSPETITLMQEIDLWHQRFGRRKGLMGMVLAEPTSFHLGGITNLVELLWHVERERQHGPLHAAATELSAAGLLRYGDHGPRLSRTLRNARSGWDEPLRYSRRRIDAVLDGFLRRETGAAELRDEFRGALSLLQIGVDPHQKTTTENRAWIEMLQEFRSLNEQLPELVAKEIVDKMTLLATHPPAEHHDYVFRNTGDFWEVCFGGKSKSISHLDGMMYIHAALSDPNKKFEFATLYELKCPKHGTVSHPHQPQKSVDEADEEEIADEAEGLSPAGSMGQTAKPEAAVDKHDLKTVRQNIRELKKQLKIAVENGDRVKERELDSAINTARKYIRANTNRRGDPRIVDPARRIKDNIRQRLKDALMAILDKCPELEVHLRVALEHKFFLSYRPLKRIDWRLE